MKGDALIVEADSSRGAGLKTMLGRSDVTARVVPTLAVAFLEVETHPCDFVLVDEAAAAGALSVADVVKRFGDVPVIVLGAGGVKHAVNAIRAGAADFLASPVDAGDLAHAVDKLLAARGDGVEAVPEAKLPDLGLLGESKAMAQVLSLVRRVAASDVTVLVRGETGTGKEVVARAVHAESARRDGPFLKVHTAGLPETLLESELFGYEKGAFTGASARKPGRVELAEGGTLFLDEIGDVTPAMQVKLLRLLQNKEYERLGATETRTADVRFVAATHRDLEHMVKKGEFREDLFYRLNVVPIWLPPLRARREDIRVLAKHFGDAFARTHGKSGTVLAESALVALGKERWPGNVRQLQNFVERLVVLAEAPAIEEADVRRELAPQVTFSTEHASATGGSSTTGGTAPLVPLDATVRDAERAAIERALKRAKGNRTLAARLLGVGRATLYIKLEEHGLGRRDS